MAIKDSVTYPNILAVDAIQTVERRYPFTDAGGLTLATAFVGQLVKFNATATAVLGAVGAAGADDAVLAGIITDLPDNTDVAIGAATKTVLVALTGNFNANKVKYGDATALTATALANLRSKGIFLDTATPTGPFAP